MGAVNNTQRVTARVPENVRELLDYAALLAGSTMNQFMVQAATEKAEIVIKRNEEMRKIILSERDAGKMWDLIENPSEPNENLKKAFQRHKEILDA